jgi:uncharacterized membrane protein
MKRLLTRHKTTLTGILTAILLLAGVVRWLLGQIDFTELGGYAGVVGGIAATILGILGKDGNLKKNSDA